MAKFGAHVLQGPRNGYGPFCEAKPAVCLLVDQDPLETEQKSGGYTVTIFRADSVYGEAPPGYTNHPDPAALARQWYPALKQKWLLNRADYYQCTNEQGGGKGSDVEANLIHLVTFEREIMRLANADSFKLCVLNLAGGSPGDIEIWRRVCLPFIIEAWQGRNIYGRHAYGDGDLVHPNGSVIIGNPSRPFEEVGYLRQAGAAGGIAITECGLDGGFGFAGIERFTTQLQGYERLLRPYSEFIGCCAWTLGNWSEANWQDALPAMTQYLIDNPTPAWTWPGQPIPPIIPPTPLPSTDYLHIRLTQPANIRTDPSINKPAITPTAVKEGLELVKIGDVTGQPVSGNSAWVKAVAFVSRPYVTDKPGGKVITNRSVNLRVAPTTAGNWPLVLLPTGREFEHLGNVPDFYNSGQWAAVALYVWRPLAIDTKPEIRFGNLLPGVLSVTSPFNAPRSYPFAPTKRQLHEGLDFAAPIGTPIFAGAAGVVDFVRLVDPGFGYGKAVRIKHSGRYTTWHGHLSRVDVSVGQTVAAGQQIALSGNSGGSSGAHYHFTLVDNPSGIDGYVIDNVTDPTLYLLPAVSLQPTSPQPGVTDLLPYFSPANGQYGDIIILKNNWGEGDERQQLQQSGSNLYVTKNASFEQRIIRTSTIDLVLDTSRGNGEMYTVSGPWIPKQMSVGQSFTRTETVQVRRKDDCQNVGNPYTSTSQIKLVAKHSSLPIEGGVTIQDVIELHWILNGVVEERYWYGRHRGLVQWKPKDGRRSWATEVIPYGQQGNNTREVISCL
jgi:murein DD-endopeptidase MepM/ murein hydrolase activator NlpD